MSADAEHAAPSPDAAVAPPAAATGERLRTRRATPTTRPLLVYILRDNRPAHFRQCEGVAKAIGKLTAAEIRNVFPNFHWFSRHGLPKLLHASRVLSPALALRLLYDFEVETLDPPDIVVAAGRRNVVPALLFKRLYGSRIVYTGIRETADIEAMDLVVTPLPRDAFEARHVFAPVMNPISPADYPPPQPIRSHADLRGARIALLIGGESSILRFDAAEWAGLGAFLAEAHSAHGVEWHAATTRWTPALAVSTLRELQSAGHIKRHLRYDPAEGGSLDKLLGLDATLVTEDAMTMLSEALSAGRPVIALRPRRIRSSRQDEAVAALVAVGSAAVLPVAQLSPDRLVEVLAGLEPRRFDPVESLRARLAASPDILARLGIAAAPRA